MDARYITLHHSTSLYITLHHSTSLYITLHHSTSLFITLHHATSLYITCTLYHRAHPHAIGCTCTAYCNTQSTLMPLHMQCEWCRVHLYVLSVLCISQSTLSICAQSTLYCTLYSIHAMWSVACGVSLEYFVCCSVFTCGCTLHHRFHWASYIPELLQIEKLKFLSPNSNKTKISMWILYCEIPRNLSFSIWWISEMLHFQWKPP